MRISLPAHPWHWFLLVLGTLVFIVGVYNVYKPLPEGLSYWGEPRPVSDAQFLADITYLDQRGKRHSEQAIFDEALAMIESAERFILLDMFLFNPYQGERREDHRALSSQLVKALIQQRKKHPQIQIVVITDPVNSVYGGLDPGYFAELKRVGIPVTYSNLSELRDSNPLYSAFWRTFLSHWGNSPGDLLPNPIGDGRVSLRSYLALLNFKANHRKVLIADRGEQYIALVTSANPHDGSSAHGNVALRFGGSAIADLLASEEAVLKLSGIALPEISVSETPAMADGKLRILTEGAIQEALLDVVNEAASGDAVDIAVFYLSDRDVVQSLKAAHERGVKLRILLDPNKDAFGRTKNGIPNRQTARELHRVGVPLRWCDTHGEQCHAKFLMARGSGGTAALLLGSANFTRRNLDNYNLESSVLLEGPIGLQALHDAADWYELQWNNGSDKHFSVDYSVYADESSWHRLLYRLMEATGLSTF